MNANKLVINVLHKTKWLLLVMSLIVGHSALYADDLYLAGDVAPDGWNSTSDNNKMVQDGNIYTKTVSLSGTGDKSFKITANNWSKPQYGDKTFTRSNSTQTMSTGSDNESNATVTLDGKGDYIFTLNTGDNSLTITYPRYYIKNSWDDGTWSWQEMTPNADETEWSYTNIFGGGGCNINTKPDDGGSSWFDVISGNPQMNKFYTFVYNASTKTLTATPACTHIKKIGYYMPYSYKNQFRAENHNGVDQHPELNAYNWFKTNYVNECTGEFITPADIDAGISVNDFSVIWVNVDPSACSNLNDENLSVERIKKLGDYVKQGGNLYLSKRAVQALRDMDPPRFNHKDGDEGKWLWGTGGTGEGDGYMDNDDIWTINPYIGGKGGTDRSSHDVYKYCSWNTTRWPDYPTVQLVSGSGNQNRTDNNTMWLRMFNSNRDVLDINNPNSLTTFENDWSCRVLAVWGQTTTYEAPGMIEWLPWGDYQGKIISNGFAAYQWGTSNPDLDNVHNLTKGILEYLSKSPELPDITGLPTETIVKCATETLQLNPACAVPVTWSYGSSDESVATVSNTGLITAVGAGNATITVTASATGYDDKQAEVAVTVNAGPTITMTPAEPTAYEVITLSTTQGGSVTWTKYDEEAYFVLNIMAVDGDSAEAETIVLKAPAKATPYTITAQVDGGCASSKDITITVPIEYCH